ncbi:MAG: hypothetical protein NVS1B7_8410 [Candidatus Saccharimonadales bacterium]
MGGFADDIEVKHGSERLVPVNYGQRLQAIQRELSIMQTELRGEVQEELVARGSQLMLGSAALASLDALIMHTGAVERLLGEGVSGLYRELDSQQTVANPVLQPEMHLG